MSDKPALSYKARRRWALVILLIGMPLYIVLAVNVISWLDRPSLLVELVVYVLLGVLWILPFKFVFRGVGKADPDDPDQDQG
ncbi:DUF2842 domain-containing protein [Phaeobacter italicus]|jgi:hypothetical protein|uniref:DUF2842 domain-containing protein n=1 Tax=Phaeobacter italicus TaxID=481446 RepID=A0A0H5D549_9RHOB|nr:DUF2842 domain-containing protein [Phaeobacter italicus]MEC8575352.1 DUF2842 domain-containing protein [Pseudomonadota bacterium]NKX71623.1 DUF2842 domain-containing protein [Rhodobacteraceae bacterium R_SAG1]MBO9441620.1 DUF2842 domain-containing protein [Phaeobacter italicus]MBY5976648.1 DUF2842 domain-containing protein [Phaeobacter italicus]MBY6044698.1 DUF2842 domain-containing protein [Phaeobacter italicus]